MHDEGGKEAAFVVRRASPDDYLAFVGLFSDLQVHDPVPGPQIWASVFVPSTWVVTRGEEVLGYCYVQEYADTGYVRNVVVDRAARRRGVGRLLMEAAAEQLRSHGKRSWRLNVRPENGAALALYARMGMQTQYAAKALRLTWAAAESIPIGSAVVREAFPDRDADLEARFTLPRGQLAFARGLGRMLFEAVSRGEKRSIGLAVFDRSVPGAFPFRVTEIDAVTPLLAAMRSHAPQHDHVNLVAEDDERLAAVLVKAGASVREEILHLQGTL
jgi:ribosomal protein S18 acetylase RimI-like enzyme